MGDHEGTLKIEYDDISMKRILISTRFAGTFGTLRFDIRSFFNTLSGFTAFWIISLLMHSILLARVSILVIKYLI